MYYLEVKLRSGNWATIKGSKSLDELKKYIERYCSDFEWNIYLKQSIVPYIVNIVNSEK